jgi:uncharacterized protein (DUF433 family)
MTASSLIVSDPDILGGTPVFKGTRVPVRTLFEYLADGLSLEYFVESFPSVTREQAADVLRLSQLFDCLPRPQKTFPQTSLVSVFPTDVSAQHGFGL